MDIEEHMKEDLAHMRAEVVTDKLRFPPFPAVPEGVTIVPFKDFKPAGIQKRIAGEVEIEVDGLGIPTIQLKVNHNGDGSGDKPRKKRKGKKKNVFAGGDGQPHRVWYEAWEDGEDSRTGNYDLETSQIERLFLASHDWIQGRPWPSVNEGLRNLWDQFRLYIGLMSHPVQPPSRKRAKQIIQGAIDNPEDDDDDGYSDDDMPNATAPTGPLDPLDDPELADVLGDPVQGEIDRVFKERQVTAEQKREDCMLQFLRDPAMSIKIFLSSFYRNQGLIWSDIRCRDGPRLLVFWLNYLLRSRAFDASVDGEDMIKSLKEAVEISKIATQELPATHKIAQSTPCQFSKGCLELWGTRCKTWRDLEAEFGTKRSTAAATVASSEDDPEDVKRRKLDLDEADEELLFKKELADSGVELVDTSKDINMQDATVKKKIAFEDNVDAENVNVSTDGWGAPSGGGGGWGNSGGGGWGASDETWISPSIRNVEGMEDFAKSGPTPVSAPWMSADVPTTEATEAPAEAPETLANPWDDNNPAYKSDWEAGPRTSLLPLLGPSVFPLTHETGVVEWSTRRIVRLEPPASSEAALEGASAAELVEEELGRRLGKVVLAPWPDWDKYEKSDITTPVILPKSRGKVVSPDGGVSGEGEGKPHNPAKDNIAVLVDPSVLEKMVVGMGLGATWIQIVPQGSEDAAGRRTAPGRYWYTEQLMHVLPSFHTEL